MIDLYKVFNLSSQATSEELCNALFVEKKKWIAQLNTADSDDKRKEAEKRIKLIDVALDIFIDPFKLAEYNNSLGVDDATLEKQELISKAKDMVDNSDNDRFTLVNNNDNCSSEQLVMAKYSPLGNGDVSTLTYEQTRNLYSMYASLNSEENAKKWAEYAATKGNKYISSIVNEKTNKEPLKQIQDNLKSINTSEINKKVSESSTGQQIQKNVTKTNINKISNWIKTHKKLIKILVCCFLVAILLQSIVLPTLKNKATNNLKDVVNGVSKNTEDNEGSITATQDKSKIVSLYDLVPTKESHNFDLAEKAVNTFGNILHNSILLSSGSYNGNEPLITYDLNGKYKRFTANLSTGDDSHAEYYLWIYKDGNRDEPIFEKTMKRTSEISTIDLDVSGVSTLSIALTKYSFSDRVEAILSDAYFYCDNDIDNLSLVALPTLDAQNNTKLILFKPVVSIDAKSQDSNTKNTLGDTFNETIILSNGSYDSDNPYITYYLNNMYKRFTANISTGDNSDTYYTFSIYGDDNFDDLLYQANMNRYSEVTEVDIDVTNKKFLTFSVKKNHASDSVELIIANPYVYTENNTQNYSSKFLPSYENTKATKITSMKMVADSNATLKTIVKNAQGNELTHSVLLNSGSYNFYETYATYYLHNDYKRFNFMLDTYEDTSNYYSVIIYGDLNKDNILYSSSRNADSKQEKVEIDISNLKFITIALLKNTSSSSAGIILSDAYFEVE